MVCLCPERGEGCSLDRDAIRDCSHHDASAAFLASEGGIQIGGIRHGDRRNLGQHAGAFGIARLPERYHDSRLGALLDIRAMGALRRTDQHDLSMAEVARDARRGARCDCRTAVVSRWSCARGAALRKTLAGGGRAGPRMGGVAARCDSVVAACWGGRTPCTWRVRAPTAATNMTRGILADDSLAHLDPALVSGIGGRYAVTKPQL